MDADRGGLQALEGFDRRRPLPFSIACRMLGSLKEVEDAGEAPPLGMVSR